MRRIRLLALVAVAVFTVAVGRAAAATITVNTTFDDTTPGDGLCSLRKAIADVDAPGSNSGDCAPAAFGANTIMLGSGTFVLLGPTSGTTSALVIPAGVSDLTITGAGEGHTTVAAGQPGVRALEIAAGAGIAIDDLTISGSHAPDGAIGSPGVGGASGGGASGGGGGAPGADGGAILNAGTLALTDAAVTNSTAGSGGAGGAGASSAAGAGAQGGAGGAGGDGGAVFNTGTLTLTGVTISADQAGAGGAGGGGGAGAGGPGGGGGAGGAGGDGGAVANRGMLVVIASTINADTAGAGGGGGSGGQGSTPTGNAWAPSPGGAGGAGAAGGGVSSIGGELTVGNSTFASNVAGAGGAGGSAGADGTTLGAGGPGGAGGAGGGVSAQSTVGAALQSVTLAGNDAGSPGAGGAGATPGTAGSAGIAGGVLAGTAASASVQNTLLFRNGGGNCSGAIIDAGHDLADAAAGCPDTFAVGDPNLGPLQDNGGPTKTISLQAPSAAIDQVPATGAGCQRTDERGVPRPSGSECDIGAYEVAPPAIVAAAVVTGASRRGATLNAEVTPNSGDATVTFDYGTTSRYGSATRAQQVSGVTAVLVSARLTRLKADTTYHYRVIAHSTDGSSESADQTFTTTSRPTVGSLVLTPARFRARARGASAGATGTTITYTDTAAARTRFEVLAATTGVLSGRRCVSAPVHSGQARRCTRYVNVGGFTHADVAGRDRLHFGGEIGGRALAAGAYELQATPSAAGRSGATVTVTFRIVA